MTETDGQVTQVIQTVVRLLEGTGLDFPGRLDMRGRTLPVTTPTCPGREESLRMQVATPSHRLETVKELECPMPRPIEADHPRCKRPLPLRYRDSQPILKKKVEGVSHSSNQDLNCPLKYQCLTHRRS